PPAHPRAGRGVPRGAAAARRPRRAPAPDARRHTLGRRSCHRQGLRRPHARLPPMRGQRRSLIYFLLFAAIGMVALLAYESFPSQGPQDRQAGQLAKAVTAYKACHGGSGGEPGIDCSDKANIISDDPNQQTVVEGDNQTVDWYSAAGVKYRST